jgi:hypothetical protein
VHAVLGPAVLSLHPTNPVRQGPSSSSTKQPAAAAAGVAACLCGTQPPVFTTSPKGVSPHTIVTCIAASSNSVVHQPGRQAGSRRVTRCHPSLQQCCMGANQDFQKPAALVGLRPGAAQSVGATGTGLATDTSSSGGGMQVGEQAARAVSKRVRVLVACVAQTHLQPVTQSVHPSGGCCTCS